MGIILPPPFGIQYITKIITESLRIFGDVVVGRRANRFFIWLSFLGAVCNPAPHVASMILHVVVKEITTAEGRHYMIMDSRFIMEHDKLIPHSYHKLYSQHKLHWEKCGQNVILRHLPIHSVSQYTWWESIQNPVFLEQYQCTLIWGSMVTGVVSVYFHNVFTVFSKQGLGSIKWSLLSTSLT